MSRGQALPLDASEIYDSLSAAETYASTSAIAYEGQTVKAKTADGKYHEYILQPSESGYILEEVGAIKASDLKQHVQVVDWLPQSGQEEGVLYLLDNNTAIAPDNPYDGDDPLYDARGGWIWADNTWKQVFEGYKVNHDAISALEEDIESINSDLAEKAPIANPVFTGTVKVGTEEVAVKSYVDGLISNLKSSVPDILIPEHINDPMFESTTFKQGETYRVLEAGTVFGHECEAGDVVIILKTFFWNPTNDPNQDFGGDTPQYTLDRPPVNDVLVIQSNIDGAVSSSADTSTVGEIVVFDAVTGKVIKGSGIQIASLNDAIAKAHEHSNKAKLDTYDKTQTELLATAKSEAEGLVNALNGTVTAALNNKADKATTLAGYGITDAYNKTEIDGKIQTITENLNTKISATDVDAKIAEAKEDTLEEAAAAAGTALENRIGAIPADTTIKSYVDTAVGAGGTASADAIAKAKQEAINASKTYTDERLAVTVF